MPDPSRPSPLQPLAVEQPTVVKSQGKEKEEWLKAIQAELANQKQTLRVATKDEKDQLYRNKERAVPSRMVFVRKPEKKEARLVVCGQFLDAECETGTSNIDAAMLRALIACGWKKGTRDSRHGHSCSVF